MNKALIIQMAREAGMVAIYFNRTSFDNEMSAYTPELERFAALVAAHEREQCAKVCEQSDGEGEGPDCWDWHSKDYATAIRARGQKLGLASRKQAHYNAI